MEGRTASGSLDGNKLLQTGLQRCFSGVAERDQVLSSATQETIRFFEPEPLIYSCHLVRIGVVRFYFFVGGVSSKNSINDARRAQVGTR